MPLSDLVAEAAVLFDLDDLDAINALTRPSMHGLDPAAAGDEKTLVEAACHYAGAMLDAHQRRRWGDYAFDASRRLYHPEDETALYAAELKGAVLDVDRECDDAMAIWDDLISIYQRIDQPPPALAARIRFADDLHALGRCGEAVRSIDATWRTWKREHPTDTETGEEMQRSYLTMLTGCHRAEDRAHLPKDACRTRLPSPHALVGDPHGTAERARNFAICRHFTVCAANDDSTLLGAGGHL